jgi:hypothetical protein
MSLLKSFAHRLAQTRFGQNSLAKPDELSVFKKNPGVKFYVGLVLMVLSFLISLPALAFLSYLSVELSKPLIIAIGVPTVFLFVHIMFAAGVYLSGKNYALEILQWATKRFLQKFMYS